MGTILAKEIVVPCKQFFFFFFFWFSQKRSVFIYVAICVLENEKSR